MYINTIIKTTSVGGWCGCLASWPVTVGVVSQPEADAER